MLEKLLAVLTALIASIDANTAALKGAKTKVKTEAPAEETKAPVTPAAPVPTVQDVRDAAKALLDATGNDDKGLFAKINAKHGVKKISEVPEGVRAEVIAEIKKATPTAAPASAADAI